MNCKENRNFRSFSMASYVEVHRKIYGNMRKISNPLVAGAVSSYGEALRLLESKVSTMVPGYVSEWNVERARAYRICQTAVRSLVDFDSAEDRETVKVLSRAFSMYIARESSMVVTTAVEHALAVTKNIPVEQLERLAIKKRIDYLGEAHRNYLRNSDAVKSNVLAARNRDVILYRHCCNVAFRSSLELAEKMHSLGDESCGEFLRWMRAA
ncbi:MAG: hypothetical protein MJZ05_09795 [Fibrobacter sp.]|nr:hypothetical protein [Fibrobacter sp.]